VQAGIYQGVINSGNPFHTAKGSKKLPLLHFYPRLPLISAFKFYKKNVHDIQADKKYYPNRRKKIKF